MCKLCQHSLNKQITKRNIIIAADLGNRPISNTGNNFHPLCECRPREQVQRQIVLDNQHSCPFTDKIRKFTEKLREKGSGVSNGLHSFREIMGPDFPNNLTTNLGKVVTYEKLTIIIQYTNNLRKSLA